ncbi:MAG TPA: T9SS type A sorting domain-containing protein [Candidatus Dormibacteraeota bacterium]|nr:T9SS type A sorting domain-containing protein [Candidatus Dormibacteraeota bacterium]
MSRSRPTGSWVLSFGLSALSALCLATAGPVLAGNQVWSGSGPRAKSIQAIVADPLNPSRIWAATLGAGVYRSLDGGATWAAYRDSLKNTFVRCLAVNPIHPDSLFCGTNDGIFLSTDGGATWRENLATLWSVRSITMHPVRRSILYASTYGSGIYKSFNGGGSWGTINLGLVNTKVRDVAINPAHPETLFAATGTGGGVHFSFNGGGSWTQVADTTAGVGAVEQIRFDLLDPTRIYAAMLDRGVIRSTDGGVNWLRINRGLTSFRCRSLAVIDSLRYVGTDNAGIWFTTLSDTLWHQVNTGLTDPDVEGLLAAPANPSTAWAGTDWGGIYRTDDRGGNWRQLDGGLLNTSGFSLAVRPSSHELYAGMGFGDRFWRSGDQANTWIHAVGLFSHNSEHGVAADPVNSQTVYLAAYGQGVYRSDDNGLSWFNPDSVGHTLRNLFVRRLVAWPGQSGHLYVGSGGGVYETTDGGFTWRPDTLGMPPSFSVRALALVPGSPATLYAGSDSSGVYRSIDGGLSWVPRNSGLASLFLHDLLVDSVRSLMVYAATDSGVFRSGNNGDTWTPARNGLPKGEVRALVQDLAHPTAIFCAVFGAGVFESHDGAVSWTPVFNQVGLSNLNVRSLAVDGSLLTLYAGTDAGVSALSNYLNVTAVRESDSAPLAALGARPTPARSGTRVVYSLSRPGLVSIVLYNVLGQRVRTLLNRRMESPGPHSLPWDGRDQNGRTASSGVYFLRMESPDGIRGIKVVVVPE